jgi:hypothetical protein
MQGQSTFFDGTCHRWPLLGTGNSNWLSALAWQLLQSNKCPSSPKEPGLNALGRSAAAKSCTMQDKTVLATWPSG